MYNVCTRITRIFIVHPLFLSDVFNAISAKYLNLKNMKTSINYIRIYFRVNSDN